MPISNWSTTDASNDTADASSNINWAEGQLPSTVNNSARGMMSQIRTWYNQVMAHKHRSGVAGGTGAAYTLTPSPALTAYSSGLQFTFSIPTANTTTAPSIAISGLPAKTIKQRGGALKAAGVLQGGDIVSGFFDSSLDFQLSTLWDGQALNGYDAELSRYNVKDYSIKSTSPGTSTGALTLDMENGNDFDVALSADVTTIAVTNWATASFAKFTLAFTQDGTGSRTVTFPAAWKSPQNESYTITTTATTGHDEFVVWTRDGGTTIYYAAVGQNFS